MTPAGYTEDALVEQPAITLLAELGWETFNAYSEFDSGVSPLGRETKSEVILKTRLRTALLALNPDVPVEAIHQAIEELTRDRSRMSAVLAVLGHRRDAHTPRRPGGLCQRPAAGIH